jgi:hypothetical protein
VLLADGAEGDRLNLRGSSEIAAVDVEVGAHHPSDSHVMLIGETADDLTRGLHGLVRRRHAGPRVAVRGSWCRRRHEWSTSGRRMLMLTWRWV